MKMFAIKMAMVASYSHKCIDIEAGPCNSPRREIRGFVLCDSKICAFTKRVGIGIIML